MSADFVKWFPLIGIVIHLRPISFEILMYFLTVHLSFRWSLPLNA
ncbi:hypothetical protein M5D96_003208 [Drosophila gunungcola]|uniref:Uncharacterized protein n=1 Tax=Drosophila gunungcola TaxID=103775 RepID=A0A9P9YRS2_9MUSC|nr:hypothetical protein M5D96_003208 [Drosophila gunungcola]